MGMMRPRGTPCTSGERPQLLPLHDTRQVRTLRLVYLRSIQKFTPDDLALCLAPLAAHRRCHEQAAKANLTAQHTCGRPLGMRLRGDDLYVRHCARAISPNQSA